MKDAKDFLIYLKEHPDEWRTLSVLSDEAFAERERALGFQCTRSEIMELMESKRELDEDDLDSAAGGMCSGHCGATCEGHSTPRPV